MTGTFDHMSLEEIEWQLNINLWSVIYGNMAFLPMLLAQREGCIVNMSSTLGLVGLPIQSAYNIAKFGVRGLRVSRRHPHQSRQGRTPMRQGGG